MITAMILIQFSCLAELPVVNTDWTGLSNRDIKKL